MTAKERIKAILDNKEVDRQPYAILDGGAWAYNEAGLSFREILELEDAGASIVVDKLNALGVDIISASSGLALGGLEAIGCKADIDIKGATVDVKKCINDPEEDIPKLDKSKIREQLDNDWIWQRILHQTREIKKLVGDEKYIAGCLGGPFTIAGMMVGVQDLMMMLVDEDMEDLVNQLLDYAVTVCVLSFEDLIKAGADIPWFGEPVSSGELIGQSMFEEYAMDCIQDAYNKLKDKAEYIFMHMCGRSAQRVSSIKDIGFNAFSVDAPVDLAQAAIDCDGKMVMIGNIGPANPLLNGTPDEIKAAAIEAIEKTKSKNGRLILCPGCDVPVNTPAEKVRILLEVAESYR